MKDKVRANADHLQLEDSSPPSAQSKESIRLSYQRLRV